jgi:hypothetical protein
LRVSTHHFAEEKEPDPDPHHSEKLDPDLDSHQNKKWDPDPHQSDKADPVEMYQNLCLKKEKEIQKIVSYKEFNTKISCNCKPNVVHLVL